MGVQPYTCHTLSVSRAGREIKEQISHPSLLHLPHGSFSIEVKSRS